MALATILAAVNLAPLSTLPIIWDCSSINSFFDNLDLFTNIAGEFKGLVNRNSNGNSFKIGFFIELGKKKVPFKILYEFVWYDYSEEKENYESKGTAYFSNFEILESNNKVFFGAYDPYKFEVSKNNIEFDFDGEIKSENHLFPFKAPSDVGNGEPGLLMIKFNIELLVKYMSLFTDEDFSALISQLKAIKGKHNNWWGEQFHEADYGNPGLHELRLIDLLKDIENDEFTNIVDFETKDSLYWDRKDSTEKNKIYKELRHKTRYDDFIKKVIKPLFDSVSSGLDFFRKNNFAHIRFQGFEDRLIKKTTQFDYLFSLYTHRNESGEGSLNNFVREALQIFEVDGYIELRSHLNAALEVNLVTGLKETDLKPLPENTRKIDQYFPKYKIKYYDNPRQNIADLGKGTANLIGLILKTFSILNEYEKESDKKKKNNKPKRIRQKLILIEEPEAFLHPNWQSKLADFFVYCMAYGKRTNVRFLIETHSVYLIQRLQFLVADNKLDKDKIDIIFFNPETNKKRFYNMELRKDGRFANKFGSGFYNETASLTIDILNAQS